MPSLFVSLALKLLHLLLKLSHIMKRVAHPTVSTIFATVYVEEELAAKTVFILPGARSGVVREGALGPRRAPGVVN